MPGLNKVFYRPTLDYQVLLPAILTLSVTLLVIFCCWTIIHYCRAERTRSNAWRRFRAIAHRYNINRQELFILRRIAENANLQDPSRILTDANLFGRSVRTILDRGKSYEKRLILSIKEKIFGKTIYPLQEVTSTRALEAGTRLLIKSVHDQNQMVWGHLVDSDDNGLIVVIPSKELSFPSKLDPNLEITAYIPGHDPVLFTTWIKSVIPGPQKMFVLGHSDFVLNQEDTRHAVRYIGPQYYRKKNRPGKVATHPHSMTRPVHV